MKTCTKCGLEKDEVEFGKRKSSKDGLNTRCRVCVSTASQASNAKYRLNHPERVRESSAKWVANNRVKAAIVQKRYKQRNREKLARVSLEAHHRRKKRSEKDDELKLRLLLRGARKRAKCNGVPFNILPADLIPLPDVCPVLGIRLQRTSPSGNEPGLMSLDRVTPNLGYVRGNVVVTSLRANILKRDGTAEEFKAIIDYMQRHETKQQEKHNGYQT